MTQKEKYDREMKELGLDWDYERNQTMLKKYSIRERKIKKIKKLLEELIVDDTLIYFRVNYNSGKKELLFQHYTDMIKLGDKKI